MTKTGDPLETTPPFGDLLRRHRVAAGLTQEELAEQAHISARAISDLERGIKRTPRRDTLALLADALHLSPQARIGFEAAARRRGLVAALPGTGLPFASGNVHPLPLVGRRPELALLARHFAGSGPPLLLLAGEPGIGKTRLLQAAGVLADDRGLRVLAGGCARWGDQEPFQPVLAATQRHIHSQSPAQRRADLRGCAWLVRLMPELSGMGIEPLPAWSLAPVQEHRLMVEALVRFLINAAGPGVAGATNGTVVLLDDLQWAGADALELIAALARAAPYPAVPGSGSLYLVGAYRDTDPQPQDTLPAVVADLAHAGLAAYRHIDPLAVDEAGRLLDDLIEDPVESDLRQRVLRQAGGVPFFIVSWAHMLREGQAGADGAPSAGQKDEIPWTVAQGLQRRVLALPSEAGDIMAVAAVAGRQVSRALLASVTGWSEEQLVTALDAACRARLLEESGPHDYQFPHDVIREVTEGMLSSARRSSIHQHIADTLARVGREPPVEEIAYHYAQTEQHSEAARWLERAGDRATAVHANATALDHYTAARHRAASAAVDPAVYSRLDEKLGDIRILTGDYGQAQEDFVRAREAESDASRRVDLWRKEGITWDKRGEFPQALAAFAAAESEGRDIGTHASIVHAKVEQSRGEVHLRQGNVEAAAAATDRALVLLQASAPSLAVDLATVRAYIQAGELAFVRNDFAGAYDYHQRSLTLAERIGDQEGIAESLSDLGYEAGRQGDESLAQEYLRQALVVFERIGDQEGIAATWLRLGGAAEHLGALGEAASCYQRSQTIQERIGDRWGIANSWASRGRVAVLSGELAEGQVCHEQALARFEQMGDDAFIASAWNGLGNVACERGDFPDAVRWCGRARRLALRIDEPELAAVAALGQARAYLRASPPKQSRLRAATTVAANSREVAAAAGAIRQVLWALLVEAEVRIREGALATALATAEEALGLAEDGRWSREEALARRVIGQCRAAASDRDGAEAQFWRSFELLTEMGATLEAARTGLALAGLLAGACDPVTLDGEPSALLEQARAVFISAGAKWDQSQAAQFQERRARN